LPPADRYRRYFVSDLHLFARRSEAHHYLEEISRTAAQAAEFILGGDIFDFRWATHATLGQAIGEAVFWLEELAYDCPCCQFHFLLGNHDYHQGLIDRLDDLSERLGNFVWHQFYYRQGANIFIHGDVAERRTTAAMLAGQRARWLHRRKRGPPLLRLYDLAISARLHRPWPYVVYRRKTVAKRILAYLEDLRQGPKQGVRHVYFGHIHRPMAGYRYGGLIFHNGGASIRGTKFRILEVVTE
jgi:UDP-2,3-diacylglucosamine hydrolase